MKKIINEFLNKIKNDSICFSITVTGRCNRNCSYCHFYSSRNRKSVNVDIDDVLFDNYIELINKIKKDYIKKTLYRFSGGEPLVLKDRIFELSSRAYKKLKLKPFILTNGKMLNDSVIENSKKNNIGKYIVSLENPYDIDKNSVSPYENIKKIKKYNSEELPVIPGVVIVKNNMYKNLYKICDFYYNELGELPTISELTYSQYQSPTKLEFNYLYENIVMILEKYFNKTRINLFPYIVPELLNGNTNEYLTELDFGNKYNISASNINNVINQISNTLELAYPEYVCRNKTCDWYSTCKSIKWLWLKQTNNVSIKNKMEDYCNYKNIIYSAYYEVLKNYAA